MAPGRSNPPSRGLYLSNGPYQPGLGRARDASRRPGRLACKGTNRPRTDRTPGLGSGVDFAGHAPTPRSNPKSGGRASGRRVRSQPNPGQISTSADSEGG